MQNSALNSIFPLKVPTLRETTLALLSLSGKAPEVFSGYSEDNEFIFTRNHSPTSD